MVGYKSSTSRLARLFKQGREKWKKRAAEKQKKIRALEIKVRDVSRSREKWKQEAKETKEALKQLKGQQQKPKGEDEVGAEEEKVCEMDDVQLYQLEQLAEEEKVCEIEIVREADKIIRAEGHQYPAYVVQLGLEQVLNSLNSLRGSQKTFASFSRFFSVPCPSYNSIRQWILRVGLYTLQQQPAFGTDWITMVDMTIELGQSKCLVILGVPASQLVEKGYTLGHQDVQVLDLGVLSKSSGEIIQERLNKLGERVGQPLQIISDQGSDIKKGIQLYQQQHSEVIWTYDVTHQMALLLKKELAQDEQYLSFMRHCTQCRQQVKQTALYFLTPPKQRPKARYLNIEPHFLWAQRLLLYQAQADFSDISPNYCLDKEALLALHSQLDPLSLLQLSQLKAEIYPDRLSFATHLSQYLGPDRWTEYAPALYQAADLGRRLFDEKFGWLPSFQAAISLYAQMMDLVRTLEIQLKHHGLSKTSPAHFEANTAHLSLAPRLQLFRTNMLAYLQTQADPLLADKTLLASSDLLESVFGKYKLFSSERSFKEIGQMVLTIPLLTINLTPQYIKQALQSVHVSDVQAWASEVFGQSMLSMRRAVFNSFMPTQNPQEKPV